MFKFEEKTLPQLLEIVRVIHSMLIQFTDNYFVCLVNSPRCSQTTHVYCADDIETMGLGALFTINHIFVQLSSNEEESTRRRISKNCEHDCCWWVFCWETSTFRRRMDVINYLQNCASDVCVYKVCISILVIIVWLWVRCICGYKIRSYKGTNRIRWWKVPWICLHLYERVLLQRDMQYQWCSMVPSNSWFILKIIKLMFKTDFRLRSYVSLILFSSSHGLVRWKPTVTNQSCLTNLFQY